MKIKLFLFITIGLYLTSCNSNHSHEAEVTNREDVNLQMTAYSNEFELFAEANPFVVGKKSNILSHFSHLPSFKAMEAGSINIRLIINGKEVNQYIDKPTRKGIYSFNLIPTEKGIGQLIFDIKTDQGSFQLTVPKIQVFANNKDALLVAKVKAIVPTANTIAFTKEQSWKIDFATELPKVEPFGQVIKTTAQVHSAQDDEILISSKTNGVVKFSSEYLLEGKAVSDKQVLFSIYGDDLANNNATVRFVEAQNNYEKASADYNRSKELAKEKIVSEKDLQNAKNQYENAKVIYNNLNKNFNKIGQNVSSPINGFVKQIFVKNGQYVEAGQPIATISQNKTLLLKAEVQQKYASILSSINSANIRTIHNNETYTLEQLNGKMVSFGRNTNDDNYMIPVNVQIDNKGAFVSGSFVELYLKTNTNNNAVTIPNVAIMEEQGIYFVFIQLTPELFEKREVKVGSTDGLKTEILKGISPQERIVTVGAVLVKLAQATGTLDAHSGHNH
ncbi:MAG: efflux RND transporter periplasmic adaptor subunit [Flavobacteriaceae bacterium]|nr:efflux RND transporter periplasmic adaptor subunit [Flavobacteriaceae bacterium]